MERYLTIEDAHTRQISALNFNTAKREIIVGFDDGTIKGFDMEGGTCTQSTNGAHVGMVNCLFYWSESKLMLSGGNDGVISAWTPSGSCFGKVKVH